MRRGYPSRGRRYPALAPNPPLAGQSGLRRCRDTGAEGRNARPPDPRISKGRVRPCVCARPAVPQGVAGDIAKRSHRTLPDPPGRTPPRRIRREPFRMRPGSGSYAPHGLEPVDVSGGRAPIASFPCDYQAPRPRRWMRPEDWCQRHIPRHWHRDRPKNALVRAPTIHPPVCAGPSLPMQGCPRWRSIMKGTTLRFGAKAHAR